MKTLEELDEVDSVEMGSGYLMCLVEVDVQDSKTSSDKKIFGLVVSYLHCWIVLASGSLRPGAGQLTDCEAHFGHLVWPSARNFSCKEIQFTTLAIGQVKTKS